MIQIIKTYKENSIFGFSSQIMKRDELLKCFLLAPPGQTLLGTDCPSLNRPHTVFDFWDDFGPSERSVPGK